MTLITLKVAQNDDNNEITSAAYLFYAMRTFGVDSSRKALQGAVDKKKNRVIPNPPQPLGANISFYGKRTEMCFSF